MWSRALIIIIIRADSRFSLLTMRSYVAQRIVCIQVSNKNQTTNKNTKNVPTSLSIGSIQHGIDCFIGCLWRDRAKNRFENVPYFRKKSTTMLCSNFNNSELDIKIFNKKNVYGQGWKNNKFACNRVLFFLRFNVVDRLRRRKTEFYQV